MHCVAFQVKMQFNQNVLYLSMINCSIESIAQSLKIVKVGFWEDNVQYRKRDSFLII